MQLCVAYTRFALQVNISVHVTVRDVNDNAPAFAHPEFSIKVPEELPEGTPIRLDFTASDLDEAGPNSYVHYRVLEDELDPLISGLIRIPDRHVPELVVGGRIDFEVGVDVCGQELRTHRFSGCEPSTSNWRQRMMAVRRFTRGHDCTSRCLTKASPSCSVVC